MTADEIFAKLKGLPEPEFGEESWPDYRALGFGKEDVEGLLDLASDFYLKMEQSDEESAVSIHAWRALAESGDASLLAEFLTLSVGCEDIADEWFPADFPILLGKLGMAAWPELLEAARSTPEYPSLAHAMLDGAPKMVKNAEDRAQVIAALVESLEWEAFGRFDRALVVSSLVDLKAVEEIEVIRKQFEGNRVDVSVMGDLEAVEIELGLRKERETPKKDFTQEENRLAQKEKKDLAGSFPEEGSLEEQLQYFLLCYGNEDSIRRVDQLDGFLLALCISGVRASNLERADCIWDPLEGKAESRPNFASKKEGQVWLECVREFFKRVEQGMSDGSYQPYVLIWPDAEDSMDPEAPYFTPWLEGLELGQLLFDSDLTEKEQERFFSLKLQIFEEEDAGMRLLEDQTDNPMFELMEAIQERHARRKVRDFDSRSH